MKLNQIFQDLLNEDFKSQSLKYVKQGIDPEVVKSYLEKFKHIKDKKYKEMFDTKLDISVPPDKRNNIDSFVDFHELEQLVDYVGGRRQGISNLGKNEEIVVDGKPVYQDKNYEVYYADTPRACIQYKGKFPYSWCVARSDSSNMFYTYRFKPYEPAFYFVKNIPLTEKEFGIWNMTKNVFNGQFKYKYHFFVIQVPKNAKMDDLESKQYIVSSANNDGDTQMSWEDIKKISPNIDAIREVLVPKPFTPIEREKNERFKNGISDKEFAKLSYEDKRSYLDIYPTIARPISYRQLIELPDDLLNLYVSFGIGLDDKQFEYIKTKKDILKRYAQISKKKLEQYLQNERQRHQLRMHFTELIVLSDEDIKQYLASLDERDINDFIRVYGEDKFEFLEKHLPDKFSKEHKSISTLLKLANKGDEEAFSKIWEMLPTETDGSSIVSFHNDYIVFDTSSYGSYFKKHLDSSVEELLTRIEFEDWGGGYYNDYFDGDSDGLNESYDHYIKDFVSGNKEKFVDMFKTYGLVFNEETIKDLFETYKKVEGVKDKISQEYTEAKEAAEQRAWSKIRKEVMSIMYLNDDTELNIKLGPFIMYLTKNHETFFTTDRDAFIKNLISVADDILEGYDVEHNVDNVYETVNNAGYQDMDIDNKSIIDYIDSDVEEAIDEFSNEEDNTNSDSEESDSNVNVAKLKSQIISSLNDTLKGLGQDPTSNKIENEISIIEIDRTKFNLNGSVFIKFTDKKTGKSREGYVPIKDIPNYFRNYKLFEQINRLKNLMKY